MKTSKNQIEKSEKFSVVFPFRTASMGNYFKVKKGNSVQIIIEESIVWPRQKFGKPGFFGVGDTYANSSNQSAKHFYFTLELPQGYHFAVIGGLLTAWHGKLDRNEVKKCTWFTQGRGMALKQESGFLFKGYHSTAKSPELAVSKVTAIRQKSACEMLKARLKNNFSLERIWVTFEDSIKAGNCPSGTNNFASRIGVDLNKIGAVRADMILEKAKEYNLLTFAKRAIEVAKNKHLSFSK